MPSATGIIIEDPGFLGLRQTGYSGKCDFIDLEKNKISSHSLLCK